MSVYCPDRWLVVKLTSAEKVVHYRVFGVWFGGYTHGDSWKLNSGITSVSLVDDHFEFKGFSGSVYSCFVRAYGTSVYGQSVLDTLIKGTGKHSTMEVMPEDTDWSTLNYE